MTSRELPLIKRMLLELSKDDVRLWRNETAGAWVGKHEGYTKAGHIVISGARPIQCGLCVGSSDLIGVGPGGLFAAIEVKAGSTRATQQQIRFVECVQGLGGLAGFARSVDEARAILEGRR